MIKVWQAGFIVVATVAVCGLFTMIPTAILASLFSWIGPAIGIASAGDGELIGATLGVIMGLPYFVGMSAPLLLMQLAAFLQAKSDKHSGT